MNILMFTLHLPSQQYLHRKPMRVNKVKIFNIFNGHVYKRNIHRVHKVYGLLALLKG